ncbi:TonB-dependent receptor [Sphingobacterium pedocola]|nr:TonB-dependent receptor [Sphingobacterium pedocola]
MKLTSLLLLYSSLHVSAASLSQTITLRVESRPLAAILEAIEKQSGYYIIYNDRFVDPTAKVSIHAKNRPLEEVLTTILKPLSLSYFVKDKTIAIVQGETQKKAISVGVLAADIEAPKQQTITGRVTDEQDNPMAGVSVALKTGTGGTTTNGSGNYTLSVPPNTVLVFTSVGYVAQEINVGTRTQVNVQLSILEADLNEVVVVAYGQQKKISVTGAISSVGTSELRKTPSSSLAVALAGRLPGLSSMQRGGGQPGRDDATMYLRGAATLNGQEPLILIDGVPRDNIRTLDATEVESVTVLKDASATAVFGVRGANGVILITTRRGQEGKMELNASLDQSWTSFTREPERITSLEYMNLANEAALNSGAALPYSEETIARYADPLAGLDPNAPNYDEQVQIRNYMYPNHDYYRQLIARNTPQSRVNVNALGGTEKLSYFVNGAFLHQGGNLNTQPESVLGYDPSSHMQRYNFRSNLDYKVSKYVKSFLNIGSYIERVNMPSAGVYGGDTNWMIRDLISQAHSMRPITPGPLTIDGFGVEPGQVVYPAYLDRSPFEVMNRRGYQHEVRSNLNASFGVDVSLASIVKGLSVKGMISYDTRATTIMEARKQERLYLAQVDPVANTLNYAVSRGEETMLGLSKRTDSRYNINMQGSLNYNRTFADKHDVGAMFLGQRDYWESTLAEIPFNVIGVAGRFTYAYDNRYLAEFNVGYNGSEQFAPSSRFGFFPAASVGWVVTNEKFMPTINWLDQLKFRASYGKVGNDRIGNYRFLYMSNTQMATGGPLPSLGRGQTVTQGLLANPNISWEVALKQNYGVDFGLFQSLNVALDYFVENRSDILIGRQSVPTLQGVPLGNIPRVNMGIVNNKGFEIELNYKKTISEKLRINLMANYGRNENIVEFMDEPIRDESYIHRYRQTGYSLGQSWGYKIDYSNGNGMFNSKEELDSYLAETTYGFGSPRLGDFKYMDFNKDGVVDDKDQVPLGFSSIPGETYGFGLSVAYGGFDVSVFFQGVGRYAAAWTANQGVHEYLYGGTYYGYHTSAWTPERYANGEQITYPALSTGNSTNHTNNDFFVVNRSYLRLRNIELAYTLPKKWLQSIGVEALRAYVSGYNLALWDKLPMNHLDPEYIDPLGYPVPKTWNMGLNVTF